MRRPPVRFPFVILPYPESAGPRAAAGTDPAAESLERLLAEMGSLSNTVSDAVSNTVSDAVSNTVGEKLDRILRKTAYLEAALDEHLEKADKALRTEKAEKEETAEREGRVAARLDTEPQPGFDHQPESQPEQLRSFFAELISNLDALVTLADLIRESGGEEWRRGISIFLEKLLGLLSSYGLEPAAAEGAPFDPSRHEAVGADTRSTLGPGLVARVVRQGWLYRGEMLRYAKVVVSKPSS